MKFDNNNFLVGTLKSPTCSEDGIKSDPNLINVKNKQSESTTIMLDKVASIILLIL